MRASIFQLELGKRRAFLLECSEQSFRWSIRLRENAVGGRAPKCLFNVLVVMKISMIISPPGMFYAYKKAVSQQDSASITALVVFTS